MSDYRWQVASVPQLAPQLAELLESGWEPFAFNDGCYHLRKRTPVMSDDPGFVEGPDITNPCGSKGGDPSHACDLARGHTGLHMAHEAQVKWGGQ